MATSDVAICNLALQKLGAKHRITSLDEDSPNAREMNSCFVAVRERALRRHTWNFAIKRASLAADAEAPPHGYTYQYTLPSDWLRMLPIDKHLNMNDLDWRIEGKKIRTNDTAPLPLRYIYRVTDPNEFDTLFVEVLACDLALQTCEKITQSNTKKESIKEDRKTALTEAKAVNAIEENSTDEPPPDTWDTARY